MSKIVLEPSVLAKFDGLDTGAEICDESGRTIGYFVPSSDRIRELYDWAREQFTDEELERARREPGGRTIEEILARLKDS